jgi:hypothetical protein
MKSRPLFTFTKNKIDLLRECRFTIQQSMESQQVAAFAQIIIAAAY